MEFQHYDGFLKREITISGIPTINLGSSYEYPSSGSGM